MTQSKYAYRAFAHRVRGQSQLNGIVGIFNTALADSKQEIEIREINVAPCSGDVGVGTLGLDGGKFALYRTTAQQSDGVVVAAAPHNSGSAALPSQVSFQAYAKVTTSDALINRGGGFNGNLVMVGTESKICINSVGSSGSHPRMDFNGIYRNRSSDVERLVLNAGEGIALVQTVFGVAFAMNGIVTVRNASSGALYDFVFESGTTTNVAAVFGLFNDTGSGVTLEVVSIELFIADNMDTNGIGITLAIPRHGPWYRLTHLDGYVDGTSQSILKTNSSSPDANAVCVSGFRSIPYGNDYVKNDLTNSPGSGSWTVAQQRSMGHLRSLLWTNPQAGPNAIGTNMDYRRIYKAPSGSEGLVIQPGKGIGLMAGAWEQAPAVGNSQLYFSVELVFTQKTSLLGYPAVRYVS